MRIARSAAGMIALVLFACCGNLATAPDAALAPDAAASSRDAGGPADAQVSAPLDGGLDAGALQGDGDAADGGSLPDETLDSFTCSPWAPLDAPSYETTCGRTVRLAGHTYALALQDDFRTLCVVRSDGFRVVRTNSSAALFFFASKADTIFLTLAESAGTGIQYPAVEIDLEACDARRLEYATDSESVDVSGSLLALRIKQPALGWNTWELRLIDRKTAEHRSLFYPTFNYSWPQVDDQHLVMQIGGDSDGRVRVALLRSFDTPEPERLGSFDKPQKYPSVYGNWVAWEDYRNGQVLSGRTVNPDVFAFNLATNAEVPIATNDSREERPVVLRDGICWGDLRNGYEYGPGYQENADLYCRRFSDMQEVALDTSPGSQFSLVRLDSGLAWISSPSDGVGAVRFAPGIPTGP